MRIEAISKIILVLMITVLLFTVPTKVFAVSDEATDISDWIDGWEDQGSKDDLEGDEEPEVTPTPQATPTVQTTPTPQTTPETNKYNTTIPKAGLVEDTMMVVAITALLIIAVYAFKKLSDYQNI